jgi:2-dehydro-3-deoxygalactonokinase
VEGTIESNEGISSSFDEWTRSGSDKLQWYLRFLELKIKMLEKGSAGLPGTTPVIISGMASSTLGMLELPYTFVPLDEFGTNLNVVKIESQRPVYLTPGVCTDSDVMRGEETQWLGLMQDSSLQGLSGFLCILPGTHSKHIRVAQRKLAGFGTYMTGEFYRLLATNSVLKTSVDTAAAWETDPDKNAFKAGVRAGVKGNLLHEAFMVRTNQLNNRFSPAQNNFYLSGLIIGSELRDLNEQTVVLAGTKGIVPMYETALRTIGFTGDLILISGEAFERALIKGQLAIFKLNINRHG